MLRSLLLLSICAVSCLAQAVDQTFLRTLLERHKPEARTFSFALIGDQHYGADGIRKWPALAADINSDASIQFTIHDGDIKNGSTICDDATIAARFADLNAMEKPLIYTPGDNEWTDCHRANNGSYNSLERLAAIRRTFFTDNMSLGKTKLQLTRQSELAGYELYRENAMWSMGNVLFVTVHVIGSNNNLGRNAENDAEYQARNVANLNWIRTAFSVARDNDFGAIMLVMQANPGFDPAENPGTNFVAAPNDVTGFTGTKYVLQDEVNVFGRPVFLVHGDSHYFRIDKPLLDSKGQRYENFTRVETFGSADVNWVKATVNPAARNLISVEPMLIPQNNFTHPRP